MQPEYAQYDHSPLVICREIQKNVISARDRKKSSVSWIFDPRMTFHHGAENRDEQISPRDHVNTKIKITAYLK